MCATVYKLQNVVDMHRLDMVLRLPAEASEPASSDELDSSVMRCSAMLVRLKPCLGVCGRAGGLCTAPLKDACRSSAMLVSRQCKGKSRVTS